MGLKTYFVPNSQHIYREILGSAEQTNQRCEEIYVRTLCRTACAIISSKHLVAPHRSAIAEFDMIEASPRTCYDFTPTFPATPYQVAPCLLYSHGLHFRGPTKSSRLRQPRNNNKLRTVVSTFRRRPHNSTAVPKWYISPTRFLEL